MREIKFRAWDKKDNSMIINPIFLYDRSGIRYSMSQESEYLWETDRYANAYEWMQYTGLLDNHGVEIYEGDILTHKVQGNRFVEFGSPKTSYAGYMLVNKDGMRGTLQDTERLYEVIGNIYENPELIPS